MPDLTIAELEEMVRQWKCDTSYRFGKRSKSVAREMAKNRISEGLLLAVKNGFSVEEIIAELDRERT